MTTITHYHLTDTYQSLSSSLSSLPANFPATFNAHHEAIWNGISLGSVEANYPSCVPSLLVHSQPPCWWGSVRGSQTLLWSVKSCSAETKPCLSYQQLPAEIQNITPYQLLWRRLTPDKTSGQWKYFLVIWDQWKTTESWAPKAILLSISSVWSQSVCLRFIWK